MTTTPPSDAELWVAWCGGEPRAGRALFDRYFTAISRFFANKTSADQDDLVQETFAACMAGRERLRDPERFRSYLFGVAYNTLRAYYRKHHGLRDVDELGSRSVHDLSPGASTLLRGDEQQRRLAEALLHIPLELQVLVELCYWEGLTSSEVERALGIPAATVRTRLRRARSMLGEVLDRMPGSPAARLGALDALDAWAASLRDATARGASADDEAEG
jgi:RNA polymerase sigma-70 factor, ECF subfamily